MYVIRLSLFVLFGLITVQAGTTVKQLDKEVLVEETKIEKNNQPLVKVNEEAEETQRSKKSVTTVCVEVRQNPGQEPVIICNPPPTKPPSKPTPLPPIPPCHPIRDITLPLPISSNSLNFQSIQPLQPQISQIPEEVHKLSTPTFLIPIPSSSIAFCPLSRSAISPQNGQFSSYRMNQLSPEDIEEKSNVYQYDSNTAPRNVKYYQRDTVPSHAHFNNIIDQNEPVYIPSVPSSEPYKPHVPYRPSYPNHGSASAFAAAQAASTAFAFKPGGPIHVKYMYGYIKPSDQGIPTANFEQQAAPILYASKISSEVPYEQINHLRTDYALQNGYYPLYQSSDYQNDAAQNPAVYQVYRKNDNMEGQAMPISAIQSQQFQAYSESKDNLQASSGIKSTEPFMNQRHEATKQFHPSQESFPFQEYQLGETLKTSSKISEGSQNPTCSQQTDSITKSLDPGHESESSNNSLSPSKLLSKMKEYSIST